MKSELKSYTQRMYKVGYGPDLWGIISEDSLDKYDYLEDAIEYVGDRELFYINEEELERNNYYGQSNTDLHFGTQGRSTTSKIKT